jgi:hypothetical protein
MDYIKKMMEENTGIHMMDSGGKDGRIWQYNAKHDVRKTPDYYFDGSCLLINTYHWLHDRVEYCKELSDKLMRYMKKHDAWNYQDARDWVKTIGGDLLDRDVTYTYNQDNQLSQDIQFSVFKLNSILYCVLQTHNGCDARGGMSTPRVFRVRGGDDYALYDHNFLTLEDDDGEVYKPWDAEEVDGEIRDKETGKVLHICAHGGP